MRNLIGVATAATVGLTLGLTPTTAHASDDRPCVSKREWKQARVGMKKARVHKIFDTPGRFADGHAGGYSREYRPCNWDGGTDVRLFVEYNGANNRVAAKRLV